MDNKNERIKKGKESWFQLNNSIKAALKPINVEYMNRFAELSSAFNKANLVNEEIKRYSSQIESITKALNSDTRIVFARNQINAMQAVSNIAKTPMSEELKKFIINSDYNKFDAILKNSVTKNIIKMPDVSLVKELHINTSYFNDINNVAKVLLATNSLNDSALSRLAKCNEIGFDTNKKRFVSERANEVYATASEMNMICSGADLFDDTAEEEYITESELMDFMTLLEKARTFASENAVAKKIQELINSMAPHIDFDETMYYHSRKINTDEAPFTFNDMLKAPTGIPGPGRYNYPGQAFYYFSNTVDGSKSEILKHSRNACIQTAAIRPIKHIRMIDLSGSIRRGSTFLRYIRFPGDDTNMPRAYHIPCFVSDCYRRNSIDGIKFYGTKEYHNYVCWETGYFEYQEMIQPPIK